VLKIFVEIVCNEMCLSDHFARYGGEEFVLVLTGTVVSEGECSIGFVTRLRYTIGENSVKASC